MVPISFPPPPAPDSEAWAQTWYLGAGQVPARTWMQAQLGWESLRQSAQRKYLLDFCCQQDPSALEKGITKTGLAPRWALNKEVQRRVNRLMELCRGGTTWTHWLFTQKFFCCAKELWEGHPIDSLSSLWTLTIYRAWRAKQRGWILTVAQKLLRREKLFSLPGSERDISLHSGSTFE